MNDNHIYRYRAVAFLDVLGFQEALLLFDKEAKLNRYADDNADDDSEYFYSESASTFITTLENALSKLSEEKFKYYLIFRQCMYNFYCRNIC